MSIDDKLISLGVECVSCEEYEKNVDSAIPKIDKSLIQFFVENDIQYIFYNGAFVTVVCDNILSIENIYDNYSYIIAETVYQTNLNIEDKVILTKDEMIAEYKYSVGL